MMWPILHAKALVGTVALLLGCALFVGCPKTRPSVTPPLEATEIPGAKEASEFPKNVREIKWRTCVIRVGMTKAQIIEALKSAQHTVKEGEQGVNLPSQEVFRSDQWWIDLPAPNSHLLGGGSGIHVLIEFENGVSKRIAWRPWVAA